MGRFVVIAAGWPSYTRPLPAGPCLLGRFLVVGGIFQLIRAVPAIAALPGFPCWKNSDRPVRRPGTQGAPGWEYHRLLWLPLSRHRCRILWLQGQARTWERMRTQAPALPGLPGALTSPVGAPERALLSALPDGAASPLLHAASSSAHKAVIRQEANFFISDIFLSVQSRFLCGFPCEETETAGCEGGEWACRNGHFSVERCKMFHVEHLRPRKAAIHKI